MSKAGEHIRKVLSFFASNLLPVTVGNIIGGVAIGVTMWLCYLWQAKKVEKT